MQPTTAKDINAIIIPAYNEQATIRDIVKRSLSFSSLVIVVDDGSADKTIERLKDLPIILICNSENKGKAASLWFGIQEALKQNANTITTIDGDGQHSPEDIPKLIKKYSENPNHIIIGARLANKNDIPAKRYYANKIANFFIAWAAGYPISDSQSGFRIYPSALFENVQISISKTNGFVFESEIIIKAVQKGIKSLSVAIPAIYSEAARPSHFKGVRDITYITKMVAISLISRGFYPKGLYCSAIQPTVKSLIRKNLKSDGIWVLFLSILIIVLSLGLTFLVTISMVLFRALADRPSIQDTNNIIILGKKLKNKLPSYDYTQRLKCAMDIFIGDQKVNIYLLGGVTDNTGTSEAVAGKHFLEKYQISSEKIILEESSQNTLENLKHFKRCSAANDINNILVSNRYHLARVAIMAKGFNLKVIPYAAEKKLKFNCKFIVNILIEAFHLHWYLVGKYYAKITNNKRMLSKIQ